mmetsp:Transcript_27789/g.26844  ORF Transcript_27789/g.26844 Transcript_27789/m.26844 type:complete len:130 (-) Transcript_27789:36-425(-)
MVYIMVLGLTAVDFWISKNIIGRKLVRLRWWYTLDPSKLGSREVWFFEHRFNEKIMASDNLVFWGVMWAHFLAWGSLCALNIITFQIFESVVTFTCFLLAFINFVGYMKARTDRDKKSKMEKKRQKAIQ